MGLLRNLWYGTDPEAEKYNAEIVNIRWKGWYYDYDHRARQCEIVGRFPRSIANRIYDNDNGILDNWLRKAIPDFWERDYHSNYEIEMDD